MTNEELLKVIEEAKASGTTSLDLTNKWLTCLPSELFQLTQLEVLFLIGNNLAEIPPEIGQLNKLEMLYLSDNKLKELPVEIAQLINIIELNLDHNQLSILPPVICQLPNLEKLYLRHNRLTLLPPEIFHLTNLIEIDLGYNQLSSLPPEIGQLSKLTELSLNDNQLAIIPSEICQIPLLEKLYLKHNNLAELPIELCQLTNLKKFNLEENPITSPPLEIAAKGIDSIRRYFSAIRHEEQSLNEVKVLLVGEGAAGKTSLVKAVLGEAFNPNEDTTHGIRINSWRPESSSRPIKVNIWDFGGQEIMHATHQFFLSKRSLYVLVLDGRRDERPEYWLRHIESFGGGSPVLIVLNKHDANPGFEINRPFLQVKYPSIRGFFRTSCCNGKGIGRFREVLLKELTQVEMIGIRWPKSWFQVKEEIEHLDRPYISCEEYGSICAKLNITEEESQEVLLGFLHDLGVAMHFKDFALDNTHVLDPRWVTTAVYKIINAEQVAADRGVLHVESLREILKQKDEDRYSYPKNTHGYIIVLMKKFELCYDLDDERVLIPQLFGVTEPEFQFDYEGSLQFTLLYEDILPLSILPRFIVKRHQEIKDGLVWRTGVILHDKPDKAKDKDSGSQAAIKADYEKRRINIWVNGQRRKEYLHFLWYSLREINASFEKLSVSERVPMPDDPQRTADYETLLNFAKADTDVYFPEGSKKKYSVKELLGLVQPRGEDELRKSIQKIQEQFDTKESVWDIITSIVEVKLLPPFIDINLNELFKKIIATQRRK